MGWLTQLQSVYRRKPSPQPKKPWGLEYQAKRQIQWSVQEISALHAAQEQAHLCYTSNSDDKPSLQSLVLGFDLEHEQILLDEFFPAPGQGLFDESIALTLPTSFGILRFEVKIDERITLAGSPALVANILDKSFLKDRREKERVVFAKQRAPQIELLLPMAPVIKGQILNLSEGGLLVSYAANIKPQLFTPTGECKIVFSSQFTLKAKIKIKSMHFLRKPYRHTALRIVFQKLEPEKRDQLAEFIGQLSTMERDATPTLDSIAMLD